MPATTTRKDARERLLKLFADSLDRFIPADESVPLRGQTLRDFEDQVESLEHAVLPALLEERAALEASALVERAGHCPHCGSGRVLLTRERRCTELISPHGEVPLVEQRARCRCCGRSFSPSAAGPGRCGRGATDATGGGASEP